MKLPDKGRLKAIDDNQYVLTLDYTLKMLNIHERRECGIPVIIEGETGVGKTALLEMLSQLWNYSWLCHWQRQKSNMLLDDVMKKLQGNDDYYKLCGVIMCELYPLPHMSTMYSRPNNLSRKPTPHRKLTQTLWFKSQFDVAVLRHILYLGGMASCMSTFFLCLLTTKSIIT